MNENPLWYKDAVFYEVNVRAYRDSNADGHGDLVGLASKLDYLQDLGVDCLWLLPIYASPLVDDGYDIADYYKVHPDYGTVQDFKDLIQGAHQRGIRVIADLVLNHTSDQHPWFQAARVDKGSPYRDYYVWSDSDQVYQGTRIIFVDHQPSNWAWDEVAGQYFWHRFYAEQPDLNFDNPEVRQEMKRVAKFWLDMGIDGFRADAVPYLIEREGTSNENLPETHEYLRELRAYIDQYYPGRILLCEANMWPEDVRPYFGEPDVPGGAEFQMGFHFPIMPRVYMALRKGDITDMVQILDRTPPIPETCQWCTFLRNHDELTLEMVTESDRQWMWQEYAPEPRMRLNLGIRRRLAPLLDNDPRKISVANSILFTLIGSPIIYYGDEIGMGDNLWLDDRNGVRTPMQWDSSPSAGFSEADPQDFYLPLIDTPPYDPASLNVASQRVDPDSLFRTIKKMVAVHKAHRAFGWGSFEWVKVGTTEVAAYLRTYRGERILVLNNVTNQPQSIRLPFPLPANARDLLTNTNPLSPGCNEITLLPYQYYWIELNANRP
jgi:maltose alpha-D-glucosyltransferase/alpha-amylase